MTQIEKKALEIGSKVMEMLFDLFALETADRAGAYSSQEFRLPSGVGYIVVILDPELFAVMERAAHEYTALEEVPVPKVN